MKATDIEATLRATFPEARVTVRNLDGKGGHFQAIVGSADFEGKSRLEQHRMVYAALGDKVGGEVHALALRTCTPEAFDQVSSESRPLSEGGER